MVSLSLWTLSRRVALSIDSSPRRATTVSNSCILSRYRSCSLRLIKNKAFNEWHRDCYRLISFSTFTNRKVSTLKEMHTLKVLNFPCPARMKRKNTLKLKHNKEKNGFPIRFYKLVMSYLGQKVMLMRCNRSQYRNNVCKSLQQLVKKVSSHCKHCTEETLLGLYNVHTGKVEEVKAFF